jgi:hypothetical protein
MTSVSQVDHQANQINSRKLYLIGLLTAGVYLVLCLFYVKGPQVHSRTARELMAWFCVLLLLPLFWKGYQAVKQSPDAKSIKLILIFAGVFSLLTFFTVPFHSTDVFGYINRGWQQVHYSENPYVFRIADVPGWQNDPMLRSHWIYNPNPYGFLFSLLARVLVWIGNGHWWLTLALFKLLNLLVFAITAWLIWSGAKLLGVTRPTIPLYLFLWNPLLLLHHIANGHNDLLVGLFITLSFFLAIKNAYVWIVPALVAATMIKYGPVLLIPPAIIFILKKKGWGTVLLSCVLGGLLALLSSLPYLKDWESIKALEIRDNAALIDNSLHSFLIHIFGTIAGQFPILSQFHDIVNTVIKTSLRGGLVLFLIFITIRFWRNVSTKSFLETSLLIMFALICVASSKFNAWYMGMLLGPALLLNGEHWLRRLIVLISCAETASITFFKQAYMLNFFAMILVPVWIVWRQVRREKRVKLAVNEPQSFPITLQPQPVDIK